MSWTKEEQKQHRQVLYTAWRSGEFNQTTGTLHDTTGYCCLGVACEISQLGNWDIEDSFIYHTPDHNHNAGGVLSNYIANYYGFPYTTGIGASDIDPKLILTDLTNLNDEGCTFNQIADIVEYYFWDEDHE